MNEITDRIIGCAIEIHRHLVPGLLPNGIKNVHTSRDSLLSLRGTCGFSRKALECKEVTRVVSNIGTQASEPWPKTADELVSCQFRLEAQKPRLGRLSGEVHCIAGCFVCFPRGQGGTGAPGDPGWAAAVLLCDGKAVARCIFVGCAQAPYEPGLLALREGPLLEAAVLSLPRMPELLIVNATGRDHPRKAGLALHLGARLDVPTIGATNRLLAAEGDWPGTDRGATSPIRINGDHVGYWVRTKAGTRPLAVHAAWRTDPETAVDIILSLTKECRTPEPLRQARRAAREARGLHSCAAGDLLP